MSKKSRTSKAQAIADSRAREERRPCKLCGAELLWVVMESGKKMPVDSEPLKMVVRYRRGGKVVGKVVDAFRSHFATCPKADEARREK